MSEAFEKEYVCISICNLSELMSGLGIVSRITSEQRKTECIQQHKESIEDWRLLERVRYLLYKS